MYDLDQDRVAREIKERNATRVLLQLPDGLRPTAFALVQTLTEQTGAEVIISGDSCYGACDLALPQAQSIDADLIVHYGHSPMIETETPVLYVEAAYDFDAPTLVEKALPLIRDWDGVGLTTTIQHIHLLKQIADTLQAHGIRSATGAGTTTHPGQILGCDYTAARAIAEDVEGYLHIGAGRFHPLGLAITIGKPIATANPYTMEAELLPEREVTRLAMKRMAAINAAKDAQTWGILVSTKPGQRHILKARRLRQVLTEHGRHATIILLDKITTQTLANFTEPQAYVDTACPRIAIDNPP
ncbi:MAG: diphthamide biosynthesis enzyme Dph2, partial [Deltaproteobacteria bacterium]|nr:diphthamide biosynthesis enzyme Dph2 [Deltaproteobacteria bacterium]